MLQQFAYLPDQDDPTEALVLAGDDGATPRVWALLGAHRGDNNQVLALAEAIGLPFAVKQLRYRQWMYANALFRWVMRHLPPGMIGLDRASREQLAGPLPELVITIGSRSVSVVRALRRRAQGRLKLVQLGNPRASPHHFDLVVTTAQYAVPEAPNVLRLPIALSRRLETPPRPRPEAPSAGRAGPNRLLLLGGSTTHWRLDPDDVVAAIARLLRACAADGGSLTVLASRRTDATVLHAADAALAAANTSARRSPTTGPPSCAELMAAADQVFVTADSVAMISEAVQAGKPVGLLPIRATRSGRRRMVRGDRRHPGVPVAQRDLRYFWDALKWFRLAGTIEAPCRPATLDYTATIAMIVRHLLAPAPTGTVLSSAASSPAPQRAARAAAF
jgi:mitochondrial fission protein ELM1